MNPHTVKIHRNQVVDLDRGHGDDFAKVNLLNKVIRKPTPSTKKEQDKHLLFQKPTERHEESEGS